MKKCVVLGGNGFIGRHVCHELVSHGYDVTSLVRTVDNDGAVRVRQVAVDLYNSSEVSRYFVDVDSVVLLAPSSLPATANENIAEDIHTHVECTVRLAEFAANLGVSKVIFASSGGTVYGNSDASPLVEDSATQPISAYGASKLAIENYLKVLENYSNTRTISLRIANPYGLGQDIRKGQGFVSTVVNSHIVNREIVIWGDGKVRRDFLYVADVATAVRLATEYTGSEQVFNIGSSIGYSLNEIISKFELVANTRLRVIYEPQRQFDVHSNILCCDRAHRELGWKTRISIEQGLRFVLDSAASQESA